MPEGPRRISATNALGEDVLRHRVKGELRKRLRGLRNALPASACSERSARIVARLESLEAVAHASAVALFWPIEERHEVDLRALDGKLRARGVRVAYPAVRRDTRALTFRFVGDLAALQPSAAWGAPGLLEPTDASPEARAGDIDVIVVPALAVDPRGHRIGYGAGHYDATLAAHAPPAVSIVVAYDFQLVAEVPLTAGDVASDWVVTDSRTLVTRVQGSEGI